MNSLDLSKTANIFVADQTPTPTRLIKNCEEVGLFDDLCHVNPFDKSFDRAVRGKIDKNEDPTTTATTSLQTNEDSLHTPQVFPQDLVTPATAAIVAQVQSQNGIITHSDHDDDDNVGGKSISPLNVPVVTIPDVHTHTPSNESTTRKYRLIAPAGSCIRNKCTISLPVPIELTGSQVFTLPATTTTSTSEPLMLSTINLTGASTKQMQLECPHRNSSVMVSLKEHLKIALRKKTKNILTQSSSRTEPSLPTIGATIENRQPSSAIRHRAASKRYRCKVRQEYSELRERNKVLEKENTRLLQKVQRLEEELLAQRTTTITGTGKKLQLAPSTVHLVMNIPQFQLLVPAANTILTAPPLNNEVPPQYKSLT